ncbi:2'-5' RNA ligase family protein [Mycobacterium sp.]|uniref:2'-5' RNA ligase family protein n=1 Tax=Mycobacterium sp. TaxID=1785 RepID=UPI0031DAB13A
MAHSVELLFDAETEAVVRDIWDELAAADLPSQAHHTAPSNRPHVTLVVADRIGADIDALLRPMAQQLPLQCAIGAPVLFGRSSAVLARLVVPTEELLAFHAETHRLGSRYLVPGPMPNSLPGRWTAHVTLARRVGGAALGRALGIAGRPPEIVGSFAGLRRWDGTQRVENAIG